MLILAIIAVSSVTAVGATHTVSSKNSHGMYMTPDGMAELLSGSLEDRDYECYNGTVQENQKTFRLVLEDGENWDITYEICPEGIFIVGAEWIIDPVPMSNSFDISNGKYMVTGFVDYLYRVMA